MSPVLGDVALVVLFILVGGVFSASEMALVSLREAQVRTLAVRGKRGARVARLHANPNRFLAAVQIGVTLAGFLSAAFGASTLAARLARVLVGRGLPAGAGEPVALVLVTLGVSYVSLVLGELVPKRLALQRTEALALTLAPLVDRLAVISRPVIWLLSRSTNVVVRVLGGDPRAGREAMSEGELREIVAGAHGLDRDERRLIGEVFAAGEHQVQEVMVPRTEVEFLDAGLPVAQAVRTVTRMPHSRYPVVRGSTDSVLGFVHVRDLLDPGLVGRSVRVGELVREVKLLPGTKPVLAALQEMRREGQHLAIVVDEYGGTDGIVTMEDLVEELIGEVHDEYDLPGGMVRRLHTGVVEVDALLGLDDFAEHTGITLPEGPYETVAGFVIAGLGRLPKVGDHLDALGHRFQVTGLDGRRVSRLRITPMRPVDPSPAAGPAADPAPEADPPGENGDHAR
ncbi:MAG: hemolysin family protein [Actinomycetes bacterium]